MAESNDSESDERGNKVSVELVEGYRFKVTFPDAEKTTLMMDEPPPVGEGRGPNAARVLAASIANCLSASLLFCLNKSRVGVRGIKAEAEPILERNKEGYWRVTKINVVLHTELAETTDETKAQRCRDIFENYCVVTGAVRGGISVDVKVE
jgi:uncharacterized OsmC-like protein